MARVPEIAPPQQEDLFFTTVDALVKPKGLGQLQHTSWFSLDKRIRRDPIVHEYKNYRVEIHAGRPGLATIHDFDLLLFALSQLADRINKGLPAYRTINFYANHYFKFAGKKAPGKRDYDNLRGTLERLNTTEIKTNLFPTTTIAEGQAGTSWLTDYKIVRRKEATDGTVAQLELPKFLFDAATDKKNWLTLDRAYFGLMGGLDKFLYLWARKAVGGKSGDHWDERFASIYEKSATRQSFPKFKHRLRQTIERQSIPGYILQEHLSSRGEAILDLVRSQSDPLLLSGLTTKIRKKALPKVDNTANQMDLF
jgi:plasmid replication initiation protein